MVEKKGEILLVFLLAIALFSSFVSAAGVGLKWGQESVLVPENEKACMTYYVYNPWATDSYIMVRLSEEMQEIVSSYESERKLVPAETSSAEAMPIEFCFKTPVIYNRDCWIGDFLFCEQECNETMKIYAGEVEAIELNEAEFQSGDAGGSRTQMSVSAPIKVGVQCIAHERNLSLIYIVIALVAGTLLAINIINRRKAKIKSTASSIKSKKNK